MRHSLCGSGPIKANPRFAPEVSRPQRKSLCLGAQSKQEDQAYLYNENCLISVMGTDKSFMQAHSAEGVMDTPENREVLMRVNFGPGLHAAVGRCVDRSAYNRYIGRWSRLFVPAV